MKQKPINSTNGDEIDIELACDSDLNSRWQSIGTEMPSPNQRISLGQAVSISKMKEIHHILGHECEPSGN